MTLTGRIRKVAAIQLDRVAKVSVIVSVAFLVLNFSLSVTQLLKWLGGPLWLWISGSVFFSVIGILTFAHLWTHSFDMVREMRRAFAVHDPCQVYQLWPYERTMWLNSTIPQLELQVQIAEKVGADPSAIRALIVKLRRWESLGFIPREEYPTHLLGYYLHEGGREL